MKRLFAIIFVSGALSLNAIEPQEAVVAERHGLWHVAKSSFENPVVNQWRMPFGITSIDIDFNRRKDDGEVDPRTGSGDMNVSAGAETYTKYRNTTLWGYGRYVKGMSEDVVWNETADIDILYPYVLADSIGGDIDREQYAFCGGYAAESGRWAWGATMSYVATLEYRSVDPRPKNVAGRLDLAVGGAYKIFGKYFAGLSFAFRKYKQNNDIDFKSELGVDKIFHLTGLGTHYNRFAGTGLSTYYDGYRYGVSANLYPSDGRGGFLSVNLSRFTFDNILSDLNKLPLASAWHNEIEAQGGWMQQNDKRMSWGVSSTFKACRRHGTENIFGDATSSIYPQIASNTLFADNFCSAGVEAMLDFSPAEAVKLSLLADGRWSRRTTAYIDPWRYTLINAVGYGVEVRGDVRMNSDWSLSIDAAAKGVSPFDCSADLPVAVPGDEMRGLIAIENHSYYLNSHSMFEPTLSVGLGRSIAKKYLVKLDFSWSERNYASDVKQDRYSLNLSFIF